MHSTSSASSESGCSWADLSQFGSFLANCGTWGQHGHEWDALSFFDVVLVLCSVFKHKEWLRLLSTVLGCSLSSSLTPCFHQHLYQAELLLCHISAALTFSAVRSCRAAGQHLILTNTAAIHS